MQRSIFSSTLKVSAVALIIKILGLVKQAVIASQCGVTDETDAFFIASGVMLQLCVILFSSVAIPLLTIHSRTYEEGGRALSNDLINAVLRFFLPVSIIISLVFAFFSPTISIILAPSYNSVQIGILSHYIRLLSCVFFLWCYYISLNVVLETDKEFVPGRCQGLFQNVFLILSAGLLFPTIGMESLIWALIFSGIAECALVTWCVRKKFKAIFTRLKTPPKEVITLLKLSAPVITGNALYEINDIVDKQLSSGLGTGNVSYLTYGSTVNEIVAGIIASSMSIVFFAHFTTWVSKGELEKLKDNLKNSVQLLTFIIAPFIAFCLCVGDDFLQLLYGRGNFSATDVNSTYLVVMGYAVGFIFAAARMTIVKVFYAFQDTKTPMINSAMSITINIVCSVLLSKYLGVAGISLATSIAMFFSTLALLYQLRKHLPNYSIITSYKEYLKIFIAFLCSSSLLYLVHDSFSLRIILKLFIECILCICSYLCCLMILKSSSIKFIIQKAKSLV